MVARGPRARSGAKISHRLLVAKSTLLLQNFVALFNELQQFGFVEGQNLTIDTRSYGQSIELLSKYAEELFGTTADVIVALGDPAIRVAQQATKTIPILALTDDMVGSGLVSSLARPNGNTTGVTSWRPNLMASDRIFLLKRCPGLAGWQHLLIPIQLHRGGSKRFKTQHAQGGSNFRFIRSVSLTRLDLQLMRQRNRKPVHSTYWRRLFSSPTGR